MDIGSFVYYVLLALWSAGIAYALLSAFTKKEAPVAHAPALHVLVKKPHPPRAPSTEPPRSYSSHEGFKSFRRGTELTVEDIVTGLSRESR